MDDKLPETPDSGCESDRDAPSARELALANAAAEFELSDAREAGARSYLARVLVQATMPHSKPKDNEFTRSNGNLVIHLMAPRKVGLPFGTPVRLLLTWMTTEAVRTKSPVLYTGGSYADFLRALGKATNGGETGARRLMQGHMNRLFATAISASWQDEQLGVAVEENLPPIIRRRELWWDPKQPEQRSLYKSSITLNDEFFREIIERPVPVDLRAMQWLARNRSPLAMDAYAWLTYRFSYLRREAEIPWPMLQRQFGSDYGRTRDFRAKFKQAMKLVRQVYREARVVETENALVLRPSPTHVPMFGP